MSKFNPGGRCQFTPTAEKDSRGRQLMAGPAYVVKMLAEPDVDQEVGAMYLIRQQGGREVQAFEDELSKENS